MQKYYRMLTLTLIFGVGICFSSCHWHTIEPQEIEPISDNVSFSTDIQPIFESKCVSCHTGRDPVLNSGSSYNSLTTGNYLNTGSPSTSPFYVKLSTDQHPSAGGTFSPSELTLLLAWIQQGANNN